VVSGTGAVSSLRLGREDGTGRQGWQAPPQDDKACHVVAAIAAGIIEVLHEQVYKGVVGL